MCPISGSVQRKHTAAAEIMNGTDMDDQKIVSSEVRGTKKLKTDHIEMV